MKRANRVSLEGTNGLGHMQARALAKAAREALFSHDCGNNHSELNAKEAAALREALSKLDHSILMANFHPEPA